MELRIDPLTGVEVQVTASRQARPNRPTADCAFCVGGVEAPDPYEVRWFKNRFPSFPDERCEVVLYAPDHDARLSRLPADHVRKVVDLWAERTAALGSRDDLAYVLMFENNGEAVGATIPAGRMATPDDIANACLYAGSPLAAYFAGTNLLLHGGGERPAFLAAANSGEQH